MSYLAQMQTMGVIVPTRHTQAPQRTSPPKPVITLPEAKGQLTIEHAKIISQFKEALTYQINEFTHYRKLTEEKFTILSKDLLDVSMQLKEAKKRIAQLQQTPISNTQTTERQRRSPTCPIDRNKVSPKDVQIETIFNFSGKRF